MNRDGVFLEVRVNYVIDAVYQNVKQSFSNDPRWNLKTQFAVSLYLAASSCDPMLAHGFVRNAYAPQKKRASRDHANLKQNLAGELRFQISIFHRTDNFFKR